MLCNGADANIVVHKILTNSVRALKSKPASCKRIKPVCKPA